MLTSFSSTILQDEDEEEEEDVEVDDEQETIMSSKRMYRCEHCKKNDDIGELSFETMQAKCLDCQMAFSSSISLKLHRCKCNQQCHEMEESSPDGGDGKKK
ncbi:hypothetical protein H5410_018179 [Solanum commersonii]|uniref:Uncharacterized protein n=1 Tax=Solanum commersonii TaxID=4109 RepID=A0A9J6A239_SOLCO|nr:hypothetical protein H5410_018179 [Solanum commersonii]